MRLLKTREIEKITVADICRLAEINRSTFYRHYETPYELLACLEDEMFEQLRSAAQECGTDIDRLTETILRKFREQRETWLLLLSDHADLGFQTRIFDFFAEHFAKTGASRESEMKYRFLLYGYSGLIDDWARHGMKEPPEEMAEYIGRLRRDLLRNEK